METPTLDVPLPVEVRIVLENEDPFAHNFAIADFEADMFGRIIDLQY